MKHCIHKYVNPLDRIVRWSIAFVGQLHSLVNYIRCTK
ncbi:hypothetical protein T4C_12014 [Trichinella pseudospiralis]|uniref:Uncharacterized protein n=1 Tax=Trichinella pseudospiralis TaxID=6337 RepID=A0A0V1GF97_TRIPS|nr:hypothetical protein T4C_12014 [Trichinella pseudospiralis]